MMLIYCSSDSVFEVNGFFNVGPAKEDIFLTAIYGLYFSHHYTFKITVVTVQPNLNPVVFAASDEPQGLSDGC